jgi:hypothetical protein
MVVAAACTGKVGSTTGSDTAGSGDPGALLFGDANNFVTTASLTLASIDIAQGLHADVDWSLTTLDLRGLAQDPAATEQVILLRLAGTLGDVAVDLATGTYDPAASATDIYLVDSAGITAARTDAFEVTAIPFDASLFAEDPSSTWLLVAAEYPGGAFEAVSMVAVVPDHLSANRDVVIDAAATSYTVTMDLHTPAPLVAPPGDPHLALDFGALSLEPINGYSPVDEVRLLHFPGTVTDAEFVPLQIEAQSTEVYRVGTDFATEVADLGVAADDLGNPFPGFTPDGTWLLALERGNGFLPLPLGMAVVEVQ